MTDAITRSAKDHAACEIRIPYVCQHDYGVVWCHANGTAAGKGIGMKSLSILGAYGCFACHNVIDRRAPQPKGFSREDIELMFHEGHQRSLQILVQKGLVRA